MPRSNTAWPIVRSASWLLAPPAITLTFRRGSVVVEIAPPKAQGAKTSASTSKMASIGTIWAPVAAATCAKACWLTSAMISLAPAACSFSAR
jgi:hypothetical protein